jgi:hypothetical protein
VGGGKQEEARGQRRAKARRAGGGAQAEAR